MCACFGFNFVWRFPRPLALYALTETVIYSHSIVPLLLFEFLYNRLYTEYMKLLVRITCISKSSYWSLLARLYGTPERVPYQGNEATEESDSQRAVAVVHQVDAQVDAQVVAHQVRQAAPVVEALEVLQARQVAQSSK